MDSEAAAAFAGKIKEAVANQDIVALADLTSYPVYVGFEGGGVSVKSKDTTTTPTLSFVTSVCISY